ncbi:Hypothetical predicted protein [Paramuricea clavata]|uniref:Uncharacterized protein n=1 Tax=Paramuricea clavata TaxID=317549 RepID=A0A7D9HNS0_PARCT|nr:Hypothetical predicted protein [Paramuricea clavata]
MFSEITFSTWNIHGLINKVLGDKTKNKDFVEAISIDFMFLTETWNNQDINIPGYETINSNLAKPKSKYACRQSGGISLIFKNKFKNFVSIVKNTKNFIWSKISKEILSSDTDLYVCGTYIPPEKSKYFDPEIFEEFENDIIHFSSKANVIALGDFNARTSKQEDFVSNEGNEYIPDTSENSFYLKDRQNFDTSINNHGKKLIEICKTCDLRILNGRTLGDSLGQPTFHGKNGISTIDYIICNQNLLHNTKYLIVKPPNYLSDHSQVVAWFDLQPVSNPKTNIDSTCTEQPKLEQLPSQYIWDKDSEAAFTQELKSNKIQNKLNNFLNNDFSDEKDGMNQCINEFQNIILEASKKSLKIRKTKRRSQINNVANKKWFDKNCRLKRHHLRKLANQKHRNPTNTEIRNEYHIALKDYKNTLQIKKNKFHQDKIEQLENATNDPILFWKILKNSTDKINPNERSKTPSQSQWLNHFQTLHSEHTITEKQEETIKLLKESERFKDQFNDLDKTITEKELLTATRKLKSKKAVYSDKIRNEMIKLSANIAPLSFLKVFNKILESGRFSETWTEGLITPIYKSGNSLDPNNYRGICVSSCMGKLFCSILNTRLMDFVNEKKLIHQSQIGFIPGNRTADHSLTLKTLHDKFINQNESKKIYACFVDFKKAFDSVWHQGLFYQLLQNKIGGHFYDLITDMYSNTKCAIKLSESRTPFFPYKKGVRQGCTLSPLLFNIYINEIPKLFEKIESDPFMLPNGTELNSLLYADDLVILSRSKSGLQNCLDQLHEWCENWLLQINTKKTKIMIFQKRNSSQPTKIQFHIGDKKIDTTKEYNYLGLKISQNGKFKLAQQQLGEKALHALYKIRKNIDFRKLTPKLAMKIFDSIISPILLYNSEIWGAYEKNDYNKWENSEIERVHLRFCKLYLGVNRKATNVACRGELGKFPLLLTIKKNIINYFKHIYQLPENSIAKQSLNISKDLYTNHKESYYSKTVNLLKPYYPNELNIELAILNYDTTTVALNGIKVSLVKSLLP